MNARNNARLPDPFSLNTRTKMKPPLLMCQSCGVENFASEFFGISEDKGLTGTSYEWLVDLSRGADLRPPVAELSCPVCGARNSSNIGRGILNFLIGESDREHPY